MKRNNILVVELFVLWVLTYSGSSGGFVMAKNMQLINIVSNINISKYLTNVKKQ